LPGDETRRQNKLSKFPHKLLPQAKGDKPMIVRSAHVAARGAVRAGFTLMEVLVVVTILVILAGTGGVIYMNVLEGGKEDIARTQVKVLEQAASIYKLHNTDYPPNLAVLTQPDQKGNTTLDTSALFDPWGREYGYRYPGTNNPGKPDIWSGGKDGNSQLGNWSTR